MGACHPPGAPWMTQSMLELLTTANEAALILQRHHRSRALHRDPPPTQRLPGHPHTPPTPNSGRSRSPTAVSAPLVGSPIEVNMPKSFKMNLQAALDASLINVVNGASWPLAPAPSALAHGVSMGAAGGQPPLPRGPPPALQQSHTYSAQAAAAACGLTVQTPGGTYPSAPYSPAPRSAPAAALNGLLGSPVPPPTSASANASPVEPSMQRPHSFDESAHSPHTPWQQTRVQSRLQSLSLGSPHEATACGLGGLSSMQSFHSSDGLLSSVLSSGAPLGGTPGLGVGAGGLGRQLSGAGMMSNPATNVMANGSALGGGLGGSAMQMGMGGGMGGGGMGSGGMGSGGGLTGMGMGSPHGHSMMSGLPARPPPQPTLTPEQQRVRLLSNLVMERLCVWGEYRTVADWPQELVAHGSMPALVDAMHASPTHSLTIPQLVTAVKERTGNAHGNKALDMLNLKAYVRCFPALFHLRSGRTVAGRPLDVVEMRIDWPDAHGASAGAGAGASLREHSPHAPAPSSPHGTAGCSQRNGGVGSLSHHQLVTQLAQAQSQLAAQSQLMGAQLAQAQSLAQSQWATQHGAQLGAQHQRQPTASGVPSHLAAPFVPARAASEPPASATLSAAPLSPSTLQPKELFAPAAAPSLWASAGHPPAASGAASHPSSFSLFGGAPAPAPSPPERPLCVGASTDKFSAASSPSTTETADPVDMPDDEDAAEDDSDGSPAGMLAQLDALFSPCDGASTATDLALEARQAYIRKHSLDKLFASAVDRAMRHKVASPIEFIAHELLRCVEPPLQAD